MASDAAAAWDAWLADCLGAMNIDADVFGPYVTGIMEDESQPQRERASGVLELLNDASPTGSVEEGTVERLTKRWEERELGQAAAAAAASDALLAKYAADAAAQRAADEEAAAARRLKQAEEAVLDKRHFMAQLDADASSEEEKDEEDEEDDVDGGGGGGGMRGAVSAEVQRAREEVQRAALERREAISRAMEREDRKRAEHEARRAIREQAGHTNSSKTAARGRGGGDAKSDGKRR